MPSNKNQHFVPRCYLRPFSIKKEGKAINLYNLKGKRFVPNASVSGQCSGDYFYGEDLALEKALGYFEGNYAKVILKLENHLELLEKDLDTLRHFALLQYMRTKTFISELQASMTEMNQAISNGGRDEIGFEADTSHKRNMLLAIKIWFENREAINDLKTVIFINNTPHEFITSDDPSTFTNRFLLQKKKINSFGLGSAGVCFFLPLTSMHLLLCYDGAVYTAPRGTGYYMDVTSRDVLALNELQLIRSTNNIYFSGWDYRQQVEQQFIRLEPQRIEKRVQIKRFISAPSSTGQERFVLATEGEHSKNELLAQSILRPSPLTWISKLQFRHKPDFYFDGSAAGYMRKSYLDKENMFGFRR